MFRSHRRTTFVVATLLASLVALSGCGGDSGSERTRNAALDTRSCAEGGECKVGDTGPGGGVVFYDAGTDREWGRYLEAAQLGWGDALPSEMKSPFYAQRGGEMSGSLHDLGFGPAAPWSSANTDIGAGKSAWTAVKDFRCGRPRCITSILAEYNKGTIGDWYLPNRSELGELYKSNVRKMEWFDYWTSTATTSNPWQVVYMAINQSARVFSFRVKYQSEAWFFVPIRAFSATPFVSSTIAEETTTVPEETTTLPDETTTLPEETTTSTATPDTTPISTTPITTAVQKLNAPTNLKVVFKGDSMVVTFDLQNDGVEPEGRLISINWIMKDFAPQSNGELLGSGETTATLYVPDFARGGQVSVSIRTYIITTVPSRIEETGVVTLDVPEKEPDTAPATPVVPVSVEQTPEVIASLETPILNLAEEVVETVVKRDEFIENVQSQLPEFEVEKVEVSVSASSDSEKDFVDITAAASTTLVIPVDARQVTVRLTGSNGETIEQSKLIVRINKNGREVAPAAISDSSSTTTAPDGGETPETTVVATPPVTDNSSDNNAIVWLIVALIALVLSAFGVRQLRR